MALNRNDRSIIRQYLLGQLAVDEQQALEQRLLTEGDLFQELELAEDELADDFVAGELAPAEQEQFRQYFLCAPEREQKVTFAVALHRYAAKETNDESVRAGYTSSSEVTLGHRIRLAWNAQGWLLRVGALAAAAIVIAVVLWAARPRVYSPQTFATLTLTTSSSDRAQGGVASKVTLPISADVLRITLKLTEASPVTNHYRVELLRANGETQRLNPVGQDEQSVVIEIPAGQLARGQYALNVYAIKPDSTEQRLNGSYLLTVQ